MTPTILHPLADLLARRGTVVIDGAMSTALEALGADLNDPLWTAKVLLEKPELITEVHRRYYEAGADVAITASYQATPAGFARKGLDAARSRELITLPAKLAFIVGVIAFNSSTQQPEFTSHQSENFIIRQPELKKAYGAYLADGSEYRGDYRLTDEEFSLFHRDRIEALVEGGVDLFAVETQPKLSEVLVALDEIERVGKTAWVTFSIRDGDRLADGTSLSEAARKVGERDCVDAVGMNCGPREIVAPALDRLAESGKPLIVYPNSGETYDHSTKPWHSPVHGAGWDSFVPLWERKGARFIGVCFRTLPADIAQIAKLIRG